MARERYDPFVDAAHIAYVNGVTDVLARQEWERENANEIWGERILDAAQGHEAAQFWDHVDEEPQAYEEEPG